MKHIPLSLFILLLSYTASAQVLTQAEKDSLIKITCEMVRTDQVVRTKAISDSISVARQQNDTATINRLYGNRLRQDTTNFRTLQNIIARYGYPEFILLGKKACLLEVLLIHWSKQYPAWFNSDEMITLFKREIDNGNLPVSRLNTAHYFYIGYTQPVEEQHKAAINKARIAYGLPPYTDAQYYGKERIELPME